MRAQNKTGGMAKDTIIYMIAKGIEGAVGIVTMSVMTYLFVKEQMGRYSVANIAITTIGMVAIQWLVQSVMRYINKYDIEKRLEEFFSTVFSAWLKVNAIGAIAAFGVLALLMALRGIKPIGDFLQVYNYRIFTFGILWFVAYNTAQLVIAMLAALREAKLNLLLSMITVCGRLLFMVLFCKIWESRVEWIFLSYFITDGIVSLIGLKRLKIMSYLKGKPNKAIIKELKDYGMPLMGNQLATSVLNKSDIYIITAVLGAGAAGIYQTNYSLIATAFTLLNASVMRGCYPTILRAWSEGRKDDVQSLLNEAVRMYMLVAIPAVAGVFAVSDAAAYTLFAKEYVEGHVVMFWVALGMMFLGLTEYSIKHWELTANTGAIFKRSLIGGAVNVGLNLVLVKLTDSYFIASVTTFIGFFVYFVLARYGTRNDLKWKLNVKSFGRILLSSACMVGVIEVLKRVLPGNSKICLALFVFCGIIVYGVVLVISGEVKKELAFIKAKLKR